ncbi:ABC transporter ATP-binding protein [Salinicola salarius]|uniref:ABC transporter ATP-binding protein n=1 Tax=Salinicola salarius TaxID=430457 RepID=UPI000B3FD940|nr:ABC transporter ATP-binding protein [Salinicola salarius]
MLTIRDLWVRYGDDVAVTGLDLTLGESEIITLVGPTGCGKSTTLRTLAGLETLDEGELILAGMRIDKHTYVPPEKRGIGLVFQDFALFPHLNVEQNIGFRVKQRDLADHWIALLGLERLRRAMPDTLSGGQKQRVALARALAHSPSLVLLDEPLSNLDAALKDSLRHEIRDALKTAGVPALWVTHDQAEALSVGDRIGVMHAGRLEQLDTPETCFRSPASRFVAEFLGDAAFLPGQRTAQGANTALGQVTIEGDTAGAHHQVDVLVRPDDLGITASTPGNAAIVWARYEGESRLYGVELDDGSRLKVRANHACHFLPGARVTVQIIANHSLAAFVHS